MSVMDKLYKKMHEVTGIGMLSNRAIINPIIAFVGAAILIPVCWVINKYAPFFNGRFKMPEIKKHRKDQINKE